MISTFFIIAAVILFGCICHKINRMNEVINKLVSYKNADFKDIVDENKKLWAAFYTAQSRIAALEERANSARTRTPKE